MRRALKITAWAAGISALLAVLLCAGVFIAGNTEPGRAMIESVTRRLTAGQVSLTGLAGSFPRQLTLEGLELRDRRGVWLRAERITLQWSPLALLAGRVDVRSVHASSVEMERLPEASPGAKSGGSVSIPRIDVADLTVDLLKLGPQLAGSAASLVLSGNAHLRTVRDMVIDARAHRINGEGEYRLQLHFDPQRMDAALNVHEPAGGPLENILELPGLGALAATVALNGPRSAERLDVSIDAGASRGRAQGSFNLNELSADLQVDVDSSAAAPRPDLAWERATLHGRWHGPLKSPTAEAHIEIGRLRLPGDVQLASLDADLNAGSGTAALHALVGGLRIPGRRPQLLEDSPVKLDASMHMDPAARPLELWASHRLFLLHGTAETAAARDGGRTATLELRLPSLTEWTALADQKVDGSVLIKAELHNDHETTRLTLNADAALRAGTQVWSGVIGDSASLQLNGAVTDRTIRFDNLKLAGRALSLTASGDVSRDPASTITARWDLSLPDLAVVSPAFAGTLRSSGTLHGPAAALVADARVTSTLSVRNSDRGTVDVTAQFKGLPSAPSGLLVAQGVLEGSPLQVDVSLDRNSGGLHAHIHRADWKSAHADGEISIAPSKQPSHGEVHVRVGELADLQDILGTKLGGSVTADLMVRPDEQRTRAEMQIDARGVSVGQVAGNLHVSAAGMTDALAIKIEAQAPLLAGAPAMLTADGSLNLDARKILLTSASGKYREQEMRLLGASRISLADGVSVDAVKLGMEHAVLELGGKITPTLDLHSSLTGVGPALVNGFVPGTLSSGSIEAHADLHGTLSQPRGEVSLTATDLRSADDSALGLPPVDLRASARLNGDASQIDAKLVAGSASALMLTGQAPLAAGGALNLKLSGKLDIGLVNPLLEAQGQRAAGDLTVDATVTGDAASPKIDGSVEIAKASIRDYSRGFNLTDIAADIVGADGTLEIRSLTAKAAPGTVSMTGRIGVLQNGLPVDIGIKARNAQPLVSKLVTANLDADLQVRGRVRERLDIGGTVQLHRTVIGIPNSLPPNVAVLDVRRRSKSAAVVPERRLVVGMDVSVQAPQEILVQGRGLDAEMAGDLHLGGTVDEPQVTGGFDLQRGNFSLAGAKLNFTAGRVSFNGAGLKNKIDPTLDFTAQTTVSDTTATLQITGLADAPQFAFSSVPAKPQDEIMALLLFGATPQQLSALQLAEIGAVLATLSGVGSDSALNPIAKLQKSLGLDRLTVGSGTTNTPTGPQNAGASIEAGRYVTKRVYVAAKQTTTGNSQVEADIDLTKHLKLQTRLGNGTGSVLGTTPENDPGSSVGLSYQFEY